MFFDIIFQIVSLLCTFSVPYWAAKHILLSGRPLVSEVTTKRPKLSKQLSVWQRTDVYKNRDTKIVILTIELRKSINTVQFILKM